METTSWNTKTNGSSPSITLCYTCFTVWVLGTSELLDVQLVKEVVSLEFPSQKILKQFPRQQPFLQLPIPTSFSHVPHMASLLPLDVSASCGLNSDFENKTN